MNEQELKILIVDDEEALRESTASILELSGYQVKIASCGKEAVELVKQEAFDILFSDMRMPDMTGTDVIRTVKQIQPDIICIIMTAYALNDLIVEALQLGASCCLTKPFEIETMLNLINDFAVQQSVVIIDEKKNISKNLLSNLRQNKLNVIFIEKGIENINFMKRKMPNTLVINVDSSNDEKAKTTIDTLQTYTQQLPKIIVTGSKQAEEFVNLIKPSVNVQEINFIEAPISINKIFYLITGKDVKFNIATIALEDKELKEQLSNTKYNIFQYETPQEFFNELQNSFFNILIVNVRNEDKVVEFNKQVYQLMPNIKIIYLVNNQNVVANLSTNAVSYFIKPYLVDELKKKVEQLIGG